MAKLLVYFFPKQIPKCFWGDLIMSLCLYQLLSFSSPQNRKNLKKAHIPRDKDFTGIDYGFLREVIFFRFLFRPKYCWREQSQRRLMSLCHKMKLHGLSCTERKNKNKQAWTMVQYKDKENPSPWHNIKHLKQKEQTGEDKERRGGR